MKGVMKGVGQGMIGTLLMFGAISCVSNHYVKKNGGAPQYDVIFVNNCSRATGVLYLDDEYRNRRKIDVKARHLIAGRPRTFRIPGGPHTYHVEFNEVDGIRVMEGSFVVESASRLRMC